MHLTNNELVAIERELCRRSLSEFAKLAWKVLEPAAQLKWGWVLDAICLHLEAVTDGKINRLLINVPPGSMKSLLTGVIWPAWEWGPRGMPEMRFVGTAHEEQLAIRDSRRCRDLIKSEWYQSLWPIELASDLDGKREFGNTRKGIRQARAFTSMTGVRGDRIILDDPISADNANSVAKLELARIAFTETLPTRINSEKSAIIVIMQRLNVKDISGVIDEMKLPYIHLRIPMRFEPDIKCRTQIGWEDPRTNEGELMFPERFSERQVQELEKTLGIYGTAGQLQQRPSPRSGGIIKTDWFKYYQILPSNILFRIITVDTAQKKGEKNDYTVMQCWGATSNGSAILIDQMRDKWESPELLVNARAFWRKHLFTSVSQLQNVRLRAMYVEDKVSGTALIQTLAREGIPVLPIERKTGLVANDKVTRANDSSPFIESGNVYLPSEAPWLSDFLYECSNFPSGSHDDQMDAMFDAIKLIQSFSSVDDSSINEHIDSMTLTYNSIMNDRF